MLFSSRLQIQGHSKFNKVTMAQSPLAIYVSSDPLVASAYEEFALVCVEEFLKQNKHAVRQVADALMKQGTLSAAEVREIVEAPQHVAK